MASVLDVAAYIIEKKGVVTAMRLQKLVYYSQAWHLVWDDEPLFEEHIEAWKNGPVCRALYTLHRGQFQVSSVNGGDPDRLSSSQKETIDMVLEAYGDKSAIQLSTLTHQEEPWVNARTRANLEDGDSGSEKITHAEMAEYYSRLVDEER